MNRDDWNPEQYLRFDRERIQPSVDLVGRIDMDGPERIIDIGCGPGNSTQILAARWPGTRISGADKSPAMIKRAAADFPDQEWILLDAEADMPDDKYDIVFSNAAIQWIPDHDKLLQKFAGLLNENGRIAVQLPLFFDMPLGLAIREIGRDKTWAEATAGVEDLFTIHSPGYYYDHLAEYFCNIDIWTTDYYHVMASQSMILDMIRSTGLKPYLERLDDSGGAEFEKRVFEKIQQDYPLQNDGKVLFPFKRLFFIAEKQMSGKL